MEREEKKLCFVIGPIGKENSLERRHSDLLLNAVIKHVLHQPEFGYLVRRADEDADPGMIGDRVVSDIINAALVVADLTDLNPNAFYELGIRHSTERPTIHIARLGTALPFDTVSHRTIFVDLADWNSIEQARGRLAESARAVVAPGYRVTNPITQANASFKMRQSDDPRDRVVAELQERLTGLEMFGSRPGPPTHHQQMNIRNRDLANLILGAIASLRDRPIENIESEVRRIAAERGYYLQKIQIGEREVAVETNDGVKGTFSIDGQRHSWRSSR